MIAPAPLAEIEKALNAKVINIERVTKIYGSDADSFLIKVVSAKNKITMYFLKFEEKNRTNQEIAGIRFIEKFLPTPKIIVTSRGKSLSPGWILFEHVQGKLMAEKYLKIKDENEFESFCKLEQRKEKLLGVLYSQPTIKMSYNDYIKLPANQLFRERLCGKRYGEFFGNKQGNVSQYFDRRISINKCNFPSTVNQIFESIRKKYSSRKHELVTALMGQGDAHHGNIIVNKGIEFIDNEYAGFMPPFMELAKPYYNDFIGTLFFHHHQTLEQHFQIRSFKDTGTKLLFEIKSPQKITRPIKITQIKLFERKKWVNEATDDFLSLNDYLVLSHALTKNPNTYPPKTKLLFLTFVAILAQFDPLDPESLYRLF
ncbi:MAG: hypothetical protein ABSE18_03065 [Minisyncoccia bacterium]|jgi:thiamine kinase-like enzyme